MITRGRSCSAAGDQPRRRSGRWGHGLVAAGAGLRLLKLAASWTLSSPWRAWRRGKPAVGGPRLQQEAARDDMRMMRVVIVARLRGALTGGTGCRAERSPRLLTIEAGTSYLGR